MTYFTKTADEPTHELFVNNEGPRFAVSAYWALCKCGWEDSKRHPNRVKAARVGQGHCEALGVPVRMWTVGSPPAGVRDLP